MADYAILARDLVKIIGGCCGTSPEHVRAMAQALNRTSPERQQRRQISKQPSSLLFPDTPGRNGHAGEAELRGTGLSLTKTCSLAVLMHTAAGIYSGGFSSDGDRDVAPLSITSL